MGASGDLAPLAHLALPLIGKGEVYYKDTICDTSEVLNTFHWKPIKLQSKEGLALFHVRFAEPQKVPPAAHATLPEYEFMPRQMPSEYIVDNAFIQSIIC